MSTTQQSDVLAGPTPEVVRIPPGFRYSSLNCHTDSWEAYDALTADDGWVERMLPGDEGADGDPYKTLGRWPGEYIACHTPHHPRPAQLSDELTEAALDLAGARTEGEFSVKVEGEGDES